MQLVVLTVEIPAMHPVWWLCCTTVPEWAQWYSTSVGSQGLLHQAQVLCVWRTSCGVPIPPRWYAEWWQQQYQQVDRKLQYIGHLTGTSFCLYSVVFCNAPVVIPLSLPGIAEMWCINSYPALSCPCTRRTVLDWRYLDNNQYPNSVVGINGSTVAIFPDLPTWGWWSIIVCNRTLSAYTIWVSPLWPWALHIMCT